MPTTLEEYEDSDTSFEELQDDMNDKDKKCALHFSNPSTYGEYASEEEENIPFNAPPATNLSVERSIVSTYVVGRLVTMGTIL